MKFLLVFLATLNVAFPFVLNENRIIHGNEAAPHSNPWQCGLLVSLAAFPGATSACGGSILSANIVLTSALCLQDSDRALVIAGAHRMFEFESTQQRIYVERENYIIHPEYDNGLIRNDIALLRLTAAVTFNEYVQPIQLPSDELLASDFIGEDTQVAGWGRFSDWTGASSEVLKITRNYVIGNERCIEHFGRLISNVTMCLETHYSRTSTCRGDHGSPITWKRDQDNERIVIGTVSFGVWIFNFGCDPQGNHYIPTVNTLITHFVPWIRQHMNNN